MSFNPQFDGSGSGASDVDADAPENEVDSEMPDDQASLAEPDVEEAARQMSAAQDVDLQAVQQREQQAADADSASQTTARPTTGTPGGSGATSNQTSSGGSQSTSTQQQQSIDVGEIERSRPTTQQPSEEAETAPTVEDTDTVATGGVDDPRVSTGAPEPADVDVEAPDDQTETDTPEPPTENIEIASPGGDTRTVVRDTETGRILGTPEEVEAQREVQRQAAVEEFERRIEEEIGRDIDPGEAFTVERTAQGFEATLTGAFAGELSREAARDAGIDLVAGAREVVPDGPVIESGRIQVGTEELQEAERQQFHRAQQGTGGINVEAVERATAAREREQLQQAERRLEQQIEEDTGRTVDLDRDDFRITDEGTVELTQEGVDKVQTEPLTEFVTDVERRGTGVLTTAARAVGINENVEFDIPGEGPVAEGIGVERDLGDVPIRVRAGPEDEFMTFEEVLGDVEESIFEATEAETGAFARRFVDEDQIQTEGFTEEQRQRQAFATGVTQGIARTPAFLVGGVGLAKDTVDVGAEITGAVARGDFDRVSEIVDDAEQSALNIGAQASVAAIEEPVQTAGAGAGSLVGTGLLFAGAAAAGRGTSLATRGLIQPGEEIAGFGLNLAPRGIGRAVGRPEAGRRIGETIAPNKEPLIFSEEAFIRGVRRVSDRVSPRAAAARSRAVDLALGEPETTVEFDATKVDPIQRTTARPGPGAQIRRAAQRVDEAFSGRTFAGVPIPRTEFETGRQTRPSVESETEVMVDELEGPLRRMEEAQARRRRADPIGETAGRPTEMRVRPAEPEITTEFEGAELRRRRAETSVEDTGQFLVEVADIDQQLAQDVALDQELGIEPRQDIDTDIESRQETRADTELEQAEEIELELEFEPPRGETRSETEIETEVEFESEIESEIELEGGGERRETRGDVLEDIEEEFFETESFFERTETPFDEIESDLEDIDKELEDLD